MPRLPLQDAAGTERALEMKNIERVVFGKVSHLMRLPPGEKAAAYMKWLRGKSVGKRKKIIALRKQIGRARKPLLHGLKSAVAEMMQQNPKFKGAIVWGSFARGKMMPRDIDVVPIIFESRLRRAESALGKKLSAEFFAEIKKRTGLKAHTGIATTSLGYKSLAELKESLIWVFDYCMGIEKLQPWHFFGDSKTKALIERALKEIKAQK